MSRRDAAIVVGLDSSGQPGHSNLFLAVRAHTSIGRARHKQCRRYKCAFRCALVPCCLRFCLRPPWKRMVRLEANCCGVPSPALLSRV